MQTMKRLFRSALRIATASVSLLLLGVIGLRIAITQPTPGSYPFQSGQRADPQILEQHVRFFTDTVFPRDYLHTDNLDHAAHYVSRAFQQVGAHVSEQPYSIDGREYRNIIARFGPPHGPVVVVGAHYDAYSELPGADDNASGAAGLLEAARLLASHTHETPVELVAYSTEEPPFFRSPDMGSAIHASSLRKSNRRIIAMIGLEMIGYFSEVQPAPFAVLRLLYPATGDFIVVAGRWADRSLIKEVKKSMRGASALDVRSYCGPTDLGSDLSDHRNYWGDRSHAVMVTDTAFIRNPNYHSKTDTPDTLDYSRMASVVDGVVNAVLTLAGKD